MKTAKEMIEEVSKGAPVKKALAGVVVEQEITFPSVLKSKFSTMGKALTAIAQAADKFSDADNKAARDFLDKIANKKIGDFESSEDLLRVVLANYAVAEPSRRPAGG